VDPYLMVYYAAALAVLACYGLAGTALLILDVVNAMIPDKTEKCRACLMVSTNCVATHRGPLCPLCVDAVIEQRRQERVRLAQEREVRGIVEQIERFTVGA